MRDYVRISKGVVMNQGYFGRRRLVERFICFLTGKYFDIDHVPHELGCEDISSKGARVFTALPLTVNSHLSFDIATRKKSLLSLEGTVCWCKKAIHGYRSGIAFDRDLPIDVTRII